MDAKALQTIRETDETGTVVAEYIDSGGRIDVATPSKPTLLGQALALFLPAGYPESVTSDYVNYQIYDSLQAFSSSIAGLLSNRAVLQGVGVGDATASPTAALLLTVLQESTGRIATIWFAHSLGTSLEPECKMYRLAADIFNDGAMILDCLSPALPRVSRVVMLSCSSVLRALCGVAAGSAKASLSAHFAKGGNLGEVNAKDSSQETVISLLGMLVGSLVVSHVQSSTATWTWLLLLLSIHLTMNYAAVRAVRMQTLNRQRANLVFSTLMEDDVVLTPAEVSIKERIFERDGALRWKGAAGRMLARCSIGGRLDSLILSLGRRTGGSRTTAFRDVRIRLGELNALFKAQEYVLWFDRDCDRAYVVLKQHSSVRGRLKGWAHALLVAHDVVTGRHEKEEDSTIEMMQILQRSLKTLEGRFDGWVTRLGKAGWDVDTGALETIHGSRIIAE